MNLFLKKYFGNNKLADSSYRFCKYEALKSSTPKTIVVSLVDEKEIEENGVKKRCYWYS